MRRILVILNTLLLATLLSRYASSDEVQGRSNEQAIILPPPPTLPGVLGPVDELLPTFPAPPAFPDTAPLLPSNQVTPVAPTILSTEVPAEVFPIVAPSEIAGVEVDTAPIVITRTPKWYHLAYWFGPTPWDIGFELGINGAEGINETLSFRTGGHLKRETDFWKFDTTLVYNKNSANGLETQNNALLDVRVDRKLGESPWSLYFLNQELYDEFQAYDLRVSANTGLGYQFIDTQHLDLVGRFGAGASREFGGPDDSTAYEALFGFEYDHELTRAQRLSAKVDYFPEWEDFSRYRVVTDVGWEIDLDRPSNMSLKFSIIDRYDSTPNGADPNEINYSVLLIWGI